MQGLIAAFWRNLIYNLNTYWSILNAFVELGRWLWSYDDNYRTTLKELKKWFRQQDIKGILGPLLVVTASLIVGGSLTYVGFQTWDLNRSITEWRFSPTLPTYTAFQPQYGDYDLSWTDYQGIEQTQNGFGLKWEVVILNPADVPHWIPRLAITLVQGNDIDKACYTQVPVESLVWTVGTKQFIVHQDGNWDDYGGVMMEPHGAKRLILYLFKENDMEGDVGEYGATQMWRKWYKASAPNENGRLRLAVGREPWLGTAEDPNVKALECSGNLTIESFSDFDTLIVDVKPL